MGDLRLAGSLSGPSTSNSNTSTGKRASTGSNPQQNKKARPSGPTLSNDWWAAGKIILDICAHGPSDPSRIADKAFLLLLPLEVLEEYRTSRLLTDVPGASKLDPWLAGLHNLEKSHTLTMTRQLQTLIDICMFMRLHRARSFLASTSPEEEAAFQQLANSFHVDTISIFQDDNEGPANDKNEKKRQTLLAQLSCIGAKGLGIASILGSSCFLVFLMLSKQMSTQGRIRSTTNPTLAALSYLLRGGRPQLEGLPPDERQRAEAVIFGAQVILPRALNYFLAAAARGFDNRATHNPVTALYITDTKPSVASPIESPPDTMPLPQPLLVRRTSAGDNLPALTFGLMSGYGQDRQPLLLPAPWLLTTGYHHFKEQSVEARNKKDLSHVFPGPVSGFDPLYPVLPNQTNVSFEAEYEHAVLLAPAYSAHFGLRENNAGMIAIMDSVKRGSLLTGDIPPVPSHYNLRLRHTEIQLTRGGDQATLPAATIGPIEIDEEDEDDSLERVVDDE